MTTDSSSHLRIFLCHDSGDKDHVRGLYRRLKDHGFDPWLDEENLLAGQYWEREIRRAVRVSDVVLICLSNNSIKKKGYVQKEIKLALDVAEEQPEGTIYIIPVRLEDCEVPESLSGLHRVDLFEERGYEKLIQSLNHRANTPDETPPSSESRSTPGPSGSSTNEGKDWLQRLLDWPADTVFYIYNLIFSPTKIVLSRLSDDNHTRRFRRAFNFFVAMFAVYSVIQLILLYHKGISSNIGVVLLVFLLELIAYLFVFLFGFAGILHIFLRLFRVPSDFLHKTLPCFFYYAAVVIPVYAILSYFPDLVEYNVVDKAGSGILLDPIALSQMIDELLREWGTASERAYSVCSWLVNLWSLVGLVFIAKVLSKFYQRRLLTCFLAGFLALVIISFIEVFGVKFGSAKIQEIFIKGRPEVTKAGTPQSAN